MSRPSGCACDTPDLMLHYISHKMCEAQQIDLPVNVQEHLQSETASSRTLLKLALPEVDTQSCSSLVLHSIFQCLQSKSIEGWHEYAAMKLFAQRILQDKCCCFCR